MNEEQRSEEVWRKRGRPMGPFGAAVFLSCLFGMMFGPALIPGQAGAPAGPSGISLKPAAIASRLEANEHEPIVITADIEAPAGWSVFYDWDLERPAKGREIDNGKTVHIWAPPGTYEVELEAFLVRGNEGGKIDFDKVTQTTTLVVKRAGPAPIPTPPTPEPPKPEPPKPSPTLRSMATLLILRDLSSDNPDETTTLLKLRSLTPFKSGSKQLTVLEKNAQLPNGQPDPVAAGWFRAAPSNADFPYYFAVDKDGKVIAKGSLPDSVEEAASALELELAP